jgi:spermidine synthase
VMRWITRGERHQFPEERNHALSSRWGFMLWSRQGIATLRSLDALKQRTAELEASAVPEKPPG